MSLNAHSSTVTPLFSPTNNELLLDAFEIIYIAGLIGIIYAYYAPRLLNVDVYQEGLFTARSLRDILLPLSMIFVIAGLAGYLVLELLNGANSHRRLSGLETSGRELFRNASAFFETAISMSSDARKHLRVAP